MQDHLPHDQRDAARAVGVFDRLAADTLKNIVSLFEVFAREQFTARASNPAAARRGKGNIFQRLDDTATLFLTYCGIDPPAVIGAPAWQHLRETLARRHVLIHRDGIVDQKFLTAVPNSVLAIGQRLVISRADAEGALDDVEAAVKALAAQPSSRERRHAGGVSRATGSYSGNRLAPRMLACDEHRKRSAAGRREHRA